MSERLTAKQRQADVQTMSILHANNDWPALMSLVETKPHLLSERMVHLPRRYAGHVGQPLLQAAIAAPRPDLKVIQKLIDLGAPIEGRGRTGHTALTAAVCNVDLQELQAPLCEMLIAKGARLNTVSDTKLSPLVEAWGEVDPGIARALIAGGTPLDQIDGQGTPSISRLAQVINKNFPDPRQRINLIQVIEAGANLNPPVRVIEDLPLVSVLQKSDLDLADRMVDLGARWSGRWDEGRTVMHAAHVAPMVRWVMGKDDRLLHATDDRGKTPLCHLVDRLDVEWEPSNDVGRDERVQSLIEAFKLMVSLGADLDHRDDQGVLARSPRERIETRRNAELKDFMGRWGAYEAAQRAMHEISESTKACP